MFLGQFKVLHFLYNVTFGRYLTLGKKLDSEIISLCRTKGQPDV